MQDLTQRNVTSTWSAGMECWTVDNQHFLTVANTLTGRHKMIMVGKNHGGGGWMTGWSVAGEFGSMVKGNPWHWFVASTA
ncbi:hypothetical protein [Streptomyces sp. NPDC090798]|uniref:hypothetical protein n=1 Tax=Streptomyces sp. NPDC090798 TaxID=3365968 RepID=UPI00381EF0ED